MSESEQSAYASSTAHIIEGSTVSKDLWQQLAAGRDAIVRASSPVRRTND
jgi:hypothetical protein